MRQATATARATAEQALVAVGMRPAVVDDSTVVDVGPAAPVTGGALILDAVKRLARRTSQGVLLFVAVAVLGVALWSLGLFVGAALLVFVIVTRGLGLRLDVATPRPA